jgi:hypothetical protein
MKVKKKIKFNENNRKIFNDLKDNDDDDDDYNNNNNNNHNKKVSHQIMKKQNEYRWNFYKDLSKQGKRFFVVFKVDNLEDDDFEEILDIIYL